jgi:hypothetical protein
MAPRTEHQELEQWPDIGDLPTVESIQERINERYDLMFHYDKNKTRHPYVCTICNEFIQCLEDLHWLTIKDLQKRRELLLWNIIQGNDESNDQNDQNAPQELQNSYVFNDIDGYLSDEERNWMKGIALSPRGVIGKKSNHHLSKHGFSCCNSCHFSLSAGRTPAKAIANSFYVGHAPACLKELTPVELALISPVKGYGYCFLYIGGAQMKLQGTLTFMRVKERATT